MTHADDFGRRAGELHAELASTREATDAVSQEQRVLEEKISGISQEKEALISELTEGGSAIERVDAKLTGDAAALSMLLAKVDGIASSEAHDARQDAANALHAKATAQMDMLREQHANLEKLEQDLLRLENTKSERTLESKRNAARWHASVLTG